MRDTFVSWQLFSALQVCPQQYVFHAEGPQGVAARGFEVLPNTRKSQKREMLAEAASRFLASFYQETLWRDPRASQLAAEMVEKKIRQQVGAGCWVLDPWEVQAIEEDIPRVSAACGKFPQTFRSLGLIGTRIDPHRVVSAKLRDRSTAVLVSRPHLRIEHPEGGVWLLSASLRRESWDKARGRHLFPADEREAVLWDALVCYLHDGEIPRRVGVLPLRYPSGHAWETEIEEASRSLTRATSRKTLAERTLAIDHLKSRPPSEGVLWERCELDSLQALAGRCEMALDRLAAGSAPRVGGWCAECSFESCCGTRVSSLHARRHARSKDMLPNGTVVRLGE